MGALAATLHRTRETRYTAVPPAPVRYPIGSGSDRLSSTTVHADRMESVHGKCK